MATLMRAPEAAPRPLAREARLWDVAVVAGPAALAVALCLYELSTRSLWLDEAASVAIAGQHGSALWSAISHDGGNMLGYYALLHVLIDWFGHGAFVIRLPSALAAGGAAAAVGVLALRLFDRRVALAAGLLAAVSLPMVFWGQDARGYAPMVALVAGSFAAFAALVENGSRRAWIAYVVLTVLAACASFVAILAVPAQLAALAWRREAWRRFASALAACAVCWVPLAVLAASRGSSQLFWIPRPSLKLEKQVILALTSAGFEPNFRPTWAAGALAIVTILLLAVAFVRRPVPWGARLGLAWLLVPLGLMWLWSLIGQPLFTPRNALVSLPAVALLLGWLVARTRIGWVAVAVVLALRVVALAPSYGTSPENWRAATAYVTASKRPGDCVAFYPLDARMPFAYYSGDPVKPYVERYETPRLPAGCQRVWLVASHQGLPSGTATSRAHYARYGAVRTALTRAYAGHRTRAFGYASVIWVELFYGRRVVPTNVSALSPTSATPFTNSRIVKARPRT
ncbi:MAG TPA: glycosyltransferase family 39 protein [Solirubrobacteraceae bacterium]|nr:glycosyltransferase family 39 protein [Solirubrobacteraceae bacterium]